MYWHQTVMRRRLSSRKGTWSASSFFHLFQRLALMIKTNTKSN